MKYLLLIFSLFSGFLFSGCSSGSKLISDGKSDYKIFVSDSASKPEHLAAAELQKYLEKVSGYKMEIVHEAKPEARLIYVGFKNAPEKLLKDINPGGFVNEEYLIRSDGDQLLIAGGGTRGTLYGVIGYLSDYLNCRWYTREVIKIPEQKTISLGKIEDRQKPTFVYREAWYHEAYDPAWAMHNRLNPSIKPLPDSLGGSYITHPFAHTAMQLVPSEKYFATHPEYFAEVKGKRLPGKHIQLCLTNAEVLKIATAQVFTWIREHPEVNVFSVDQSDGEGNCECTNCKAIDDREGSPSGSLLTFVNQIADTVGKVYPAIKIQTFAYAYTEVPPKTIRPRDNVTIRLCHYNYCSAHPMEGCENHKPFRDRFNEWKKISKRISIWDYYTDFSQYLMPFPNFESFKNDIKWYADRGVEGMFAQGNNVPENGGGEFSELRAWVISQLLWNADRDATALVDEFVSNVYGKAAPHISDYIKLLHEQVKPDSLHFSIWSQPTEVHYLGLKTIQKADSLFGLALKESEGDTSLTRRVELAYLPVLYTQLYFYSIGGTAYLSKEAMPAAFERFNKIIDRHRITAVGDMPETYGNLGKFIEKVKGADTFYTDWWIIGPFDNANGKGLSTVFGPEQKFDAQASYTGTAGSRVKWQKTEDATSGYIDFGKMFTRNEDVVAYAYRTLTLPEAKTMKFGVGSNDGVRVWINGKQVLDRPVSRKAEPNQDLISVPMDKGENTILVKVDQLKRAWGFYFTEIK
ncbi:hypothetical protein DYBT9275_02332 [Dyadobacter sp. CECT 9275]|uniref:Alpha glucuronidase N-terminal domain-containing protein n=1 Tax=Dyadobacter helix TaxID=2822344 RepID=A0A916JBF1_9BACT|nr:DUF4838 domain-containing protein [Dyadobacter sp. CECT 9275]CAG4999872.1 hypothetical protein DYBT9275_02332 [Dyadobacter sp. CECT 9275]